MGYYVQENHEDDCAVCGRPLSGAQERYCSASCREKDYRLRKFTALRKSLGLPSVKPCRYCGEPFVVTSLTKDACSLVRNDGDECEADDHCAGIQVRARQDADNAREDAEMAREFSECAHCGEFVGYSGRGRPKRFCAPRCRTAFYRAARKAGA